MKVNGYKIKPLANLSGADLYGTYLYGADLSGADLSGAKYLYYSHVPQEGSFIAWKKIKGHIIKLQIPASAKRTSSIVGRKCRASFAKVISITRISSGEVVTEVIGGHDPNFIYKKGELVYPDSYNDDPRIECTNGIHFFITKQEALEN